MRLLGVVLAAGAGERMGGPKALLVVPVLGPHGEDAEPLARAHVWRMRDAGCADVVLVTRPELAVRFERDANVVTSEAPDPAGSLALGLRRVRPADDDVLLITLVDAWPACEQTARALVKAVHAGASAAIPVHQGRGGHPVAVRASVLEGFADAPRPLREVLAALGSARVRVDVDDPAIAIDLDTPDDVVRATGAAPRFSLGPLLAPPHPPGPPPRWRGGGSVNRVFTLPPLRLRRGGPGGRGGAKRAEGKTLVLGLPSSFSAEVPQCPLS
jgi:CTP:molybdopterin cytidylyltransferase MocA